MKKARFILAVLAAALILLKPQTALNGAQQAMRLWYSSVAPAVFPFLALMPVLTGKEACAAYDAIFSRVMRSVFHLSGAAAPAVIIAMLAGSPGGAIAVRRIAGETGMEKSEVRRLAMSVCGVSPAYLILGVGAALHGSAAYGFRLALIQFSIQLLMLLFTRNMKPSGAADMEALPENGAGIRSAVLTVLGICGWMVLFGVLAAILSSLAGNAAGRFLLTALDLPSGLAALAPGTPPAIVGAAVGFGGVCIAAQNMAALGDIGWTDYLRGRCVSSALFASAAALFLKETMAAQDVFANVSAGYAGSVLTAMLLCIPPLAVFTENMLLDGSVSMEKTDVNGPERQDQHRDRGDII